MPVYTSGGALLIEGGYNDVGRDMHTYAGDTHHHVNSHNVEKTTATGSYNDSSLNKASKNASLMVARPVSPIARSLREESLSEDEEDQSSVDAEEGRAEAPIITQQGEAYEPKKRFWTRLVSWIRKGIKCGT